MIEFGQPFYPQSSRVGLDSIFNHCLEIRVSKCKVPLDSYLASPLRSVEQPKNHFFINLNLILTLLLLVKGKAYVIYAVKEIICGSQLCYWDYPVIFANSVYACSLGI